MGKENVPLLIAGIGDQTNPLIMPAAIFYKSALPLSVMLN
jgi:hypothetical protein